VNKADDFLIHLKCDFPNKRKYIVSFLLLAVFLSVIYANSLDCSWQYDDYGNIVENGAIHIKDLSWQSIEKGLYGIIGSARWQRPLSYFSFALNYYVGGLDVFGYHLVNLSIHCLTAFFLFLFIYHTLNLPLIRDKYGKNADSIALLSALLWAINPVQVTAVTYIVQRMASMVALFYIMSMFFYLQGRTDACLWKKGFFFMLAFFSGLLAVGTKENAAMLPISIFLYEYFLIRGISRENIKKSWKYAIVAAMASLAICALYIGDVSSLADDYEIRPFTMIERLLTQPRVLIFYISLLLYPLTSRMMLIHDIDLSTSLFHPWTTIPAILAIVLLIAAALWLYRKWPLISYCIVFFFLNHLIEGSFICLELIYEHRNYLPSLLFFVPISVLIIHGLQYFSDRKSLRLLIIAAVTSVLIIQGVTVYIQNNIYRDGISLWTDNRDKAPRLHVVRQNLATSYLMAGRIDEAFAEGQVAQKSYQAAMPSKKSKTHGLLGEYYFRNNMNDEAIVQYKEALKWDPFYDVAYRRIAEIMIRMNRFPEAEAWIKKGLIIKRDSFAYHAILAGILLKEEQFDAAIKAAFRSLSLNADQWEPYITISDAFRAKGAEKRANHFRRVAEAGAQKGLASHMGQVSMQAGP
jgi:protein O-mannosyl-transferase